MFKVGIIGATGYTGAELVRILSKHPAAQLVALTTQSYVDKPFWEVYPHLYKHIDLICTERDLSSLISNCDVIFISLPHGHAMNQAAAITGKNKVVIDLGADFRFRNSEVFETWYGVTHAAPVLTKEAVYGLPEIRRQKISCALLVSNPGCYPTSAILGLAPLLKNNLIEPESIIIDSKSGVSGAGRGLSLNTHYCEVNENMKAYGVTTHRHTPEIEQELSLLAGQKITVSFTPHLTPITRGILSTIYAKLNRAMSQDEASRLYQEYYEGEFFIRVLPAGMLPTTKMVAGSNHCDLGVVVDQRTGRIVVLSAIDNLLKGASGQAVQNMNIVLGLPENTGLEAPGIYP